MSKLSHTSKTVVGPDGKKRVVYVRTPETDREMEKFRLGPLAEIQPLSRSQAPELIKHIQDSALVVQAPYLMARQVVRTRLEGDRSAHRVLNGMTLFQNHFSASDSCREGFPQFKQLFMLFGYLELTNRIQHQIICEVLFTRYELGLHFWLIIPKSLGEMAAQWGNGFENFQMFAGLRLDSLGGSSFTPGKADFTPVSVASPMTPPDLTRRGQKQRIVVDPSCKEAEKEGGSAFRSLTEGDPKFWSDKKRGGL